MNKVVVIPRGIDLNAVLLNNGVRQDRVKRRLKERIYYFLSKVVTYEGNNELFKKKDGYRPISNKQMDKIFGTRDSRHVLKILTNQEDPIIESNGSYQVGGYCLGYRLTEKYRTGYIEFRTLGYDLTQKIIHNEIIDPSRPDYSFLEHQFNINQLEFSPDFEKYVFQLGSSLLKVSTNKFQINLIQNKIGRMLSYQKDLKLGNYHISHSNSNHRFTSIMTMLPRETRNFLQVGGKPLVEVDLGSSQPYLLALLLKEIDMLITPIEQNNLKTSNNRFISNYLIELYNNDLINKVYSFMSRTFSELEPTLKDSIRKYYSIPFEEDFYIWIQQQSGNRISRNDIKSTFMYFLFDNNPRHRNHNEVIQEIGVQFPGVNHFIGLMHNKFGKSDFALFLQMIESHLIINVILKEFHDLYPHIPIFTIHDAILTTEEFAQLIQNHLEERLIELTSIQPRLKIKSPASLKNVLNESISRTWEEFESVATESQYSKLKHSIFSSNIEDGRKFLEERRMIPVGIGEI